MSHPPIEAAEVELVRSRLTEAERNLLAKLGVQVEPTENEPEPMSAEEEAATLDRARAGGSYSTARINAKLRIWEDEEAF
jgi:hypothetical protein